MSKFHAPDKAIYICAGSKCSKRGGKELCKELKHRIKDAHLQGVLEVIKVECTDRCKFAPVLSIQPANVWLQEADERDVEKIWEIAAGK